MGLRVGGLNISMFLGIFNILNVVWVSCSMFFNLWTLYLGFGLYIVL